jgi:transcription-repair coupling factor (superfamily II helicase)
MKACRLNSKTKLLCESGTLKTANEILVRLRQRFHSVDDETMKASHLLRYSTLKQQEGESGSDFVDREQKEYTALREMGINVDSLRLTKFIQQDTTNSKYKSLAQTIFTTPNSISCNFSFRDLSPRRTTSN